MSDDTKVDGQSIMEHLKKLEEESTKEYRYFAIMDTSEHHPLRGVFFLCKTEFGALLTLYKYMLSRDIPCYYGPKRDKVPESICDLLPGERPSDEEMIQDIECLALESFVVFPKMLVTTLK